MVIKHEFREPIKQTILRVPATPNLVMELGNRHLGICMGNQLRVYSEQLTYLRAMTALGSTICSAAVSQCEGFIVVLSSDSRHCYVQVIDLLTCSSICNSYLPSSGEGGRIVVNPYQKCL